MTRILVVDDAPEISILMEDILEPLGYEVNAAPSANSAGEKIEKNRPDLILLDVMMPGKDGYQFCREMKASAKFKDIPVILVTVKRNQEDVDRGFKAGASDYITKPFDPGDLVARIKKILDKTAK
ncbi:PleD family two-component system response regulator [Candidatus Margulisiibacteriota bacterium]